LRALRPESNWQAQKDARATYTGSPAGFRARARHLRRAFLLRHIRRPLFAFDLL
jgi:hypothetical protein